ncbi:MAG TPA: enoyl-CoA hydratase-related protein [Candidatus Dormibacteraeota bacterium]|nr:enoyl-CoA hydratase-related protein [Candidatus Dormibacteraeota bacterium]
MTETGGVRLDREGPVPVLVVDRPEAANALDLAVLDLIETALADLEADATCRCVVVTGGGDRAFSAGGDIAEMRDLPASAGPAFVARGQEVLGRLASSRLVSIAALNGHALGGGAELALACDLRVGAEEATFGFPEVGVGLIPGWGGTQRALRLAGPSAAKLAVLTGRRLPMVEAHRLGLVDMVVERAKVLATALELAAEIAARSPSAVLASKRAIEGGAGLPLQDGLALEATAWLENFDTEDRVEGLTAFLERRAPRWSGR